MSSGGYYHVNNMFRVSTDGASLSVRIDGEANLPWLILSNSLATDHSLWDPQMAALTRIRRVVRYDTRGHGSSSSPPGAYDFAMLCGDVISILDHLDIASADILGLSLGGMTALGLGLDHAERTKRIICSGARADFPAAMVSAWDDRIRAVTTSGMAAVADGTLERWFTANASRQKPEIIDHARRMIMETSVNGYCGCAAALKGLNYQVRLPQLAKKVLYVAGQADAAASPDAMRAMAAATPGSELKIIPGAAHIANLENTEHFNTVICDFLNDE